MNNQLLIREMPPNLRPVSQLCRSGADRISTPELIASVLQTPNALAAAYQILSLANGNAYELANMPREKLMQVDGIGEAQAARLQAAVELGRRVLSAQAPDRVRIGYPADAANLLMHDMMTLTQEEMRVILLNTRTEVIRIVTVYKGSLNTSVVRVGELFKHAIEANAAAIIIAHNHPSGDPSPSPEDVRVTKHVYDAGRLLGIELLDHVIIGRNCFTSLKERNLGFD